MMRLGAIPCLSLIILFSALPVQAQVSDSKEVSPPVQRSEVEALTRELEETKAALRTLQEELKRLQDGAAPGSHTGLRPSEMTPPPAPPLGATAGIESPLGQQPESPRFIPVARSSEEKEMELGELPGAKIPQEVLGLPRLDVLGTRINGFLVGSFSYNSHIQMVSEFAGGAPALTDPGATNFRFDKFGLAFTKTFASWLSGFAAIEVESHRDRHSHGFNPEFGCPPEGGGVCIERFGGEEAETEVSLDRFSLTAIAPIGNGLAFSLGRFDVPFGIERHDEPLNLTATTSEVFRFGRPERMTGFQASYSFAPWLDMSAWVVNRWENETREEERDFNDNNKDKSFGGRIGFTPFPREGLLNIGIGGFWGPEQDDVNSNKRWVLNADFTWQPILWLLFAGELIYGGEDNVSFREHGIPITAPAVENKNVNWRGFYLLTHYDVVNWLGLSFRWGLFDDMEGGRTGVKQVLQSWTFAPIVHLSRLVPELGPTGAAYTRTRHPIDWVDLKVEYRLNHSNKPVFSDAEPGVPILDADKTSHQVQLQVVVNF